MEEFRKELSAFLTDLKFTKNNDEWLLTIPGATRVIQVVVNGKPVQQQVQSPEQKVKIAIVGEAEVDKIPGLQILFEVSQEQNILMEYEEVFFADDVDYFRAIFFSIFR